MHLVRNGENFKMHKIDWCEGGLQLAEIATKNIVEHYLTPKKKYIMVILYNWDRTLVQEGWYNTGYSMEQEFCMTRLDIVEDSTQSTWNVCKTLKTVCSRRETLFWMKTVFKENHV